MKFIKPRNLRARFEELALQSRDIDIAVAWISASPALTKLQEVAASKKLRVRIVTGVGGYLTDPRTLELAAAISSLRIFGTAEGPLYHPKIYIFRNAHSQTALIGSANFTNSALASNIESVLEVTDHSKMFTPEFERFWSSTSSVDYGNWDAVSYTKKRSEMIASLVQSRAEKVLPADVLNESLYGNDVLRAGWRTYVEELYSIGGKDGQFTLSNWLGVLGDREFLIKRDWEKDLSAKDLAMMYGKQQFAPFGKLQAIQQSRFCGSEGRRKRLQIGAALNEAMAMPQFQEPIVQKIFENLRNVSGCGSALASRLLVLARPDIFVVVNKKSFQGLSRRFDMPVPRKDISPKLYAELLRKIQEQAWYSSPPPLEELELKIWQNRAALIDPIVYRENPDAFDD